VSGLFYSALYHLSPFMLSQMAGCASLLRLDNIPYHVFTIHSSLDGCSGCFCILAAMNNYLFILIVAGYYTVGMYHNLLNTSLCGFQYHAILNNATSKMFLFIICKYVQSCNDTWEYLCTVYSWKYNCWVRRGARVSFL